MGIAGCMSNVLQKCGGVVIDDPDPDPQSGLPTDVGPQEPGTDEHFFLPVGSGLPENLTALRALGPLGSGVTWNEGEFVRLGNGNVAHWDGSGWQAGAAPA